MHNFIEKVKNIAKGTKWLLISDGVIIVILIVVAGLFFIQFKSLNSLKSEVDLLHQNFNDRLTLIEGDLATTTRELSARLAEQLERSQNFEEAIDDISDTVGDLEKSLKDLLATSK